MINALTYGGARFTKEYVFHYPGGPYNDALNNLKRVMDESIFAGSSIFDHMYRATKSVKKKASRRISRLTSFMIASDVKVAPDIEHESPCITFSKRLPDDVERHYSTREAMMLVGSRSSMGSRMPSLTATLRKFSIYPSASAPARTKTKNDEGPA